MHLYTIDIVTGNLIFDWTIYDLWYVIWATFFFNLKDECPVNALRAQNLAGGHFLGHEIRLDFVSLGIWAILGIN